MEATCLHHVTLIVEDLERSQQFYGEVLGLAEIARFDARFPGLFYRCAGAEIHLIVAAKPQRLDPLVLPLADGEQIERSYIHRHIALVIADMTGLRRRLAQHRVRIVFAAELAEAQDEFARNLMAGWSRRYGGVPLFCLDPSGNLLELIPAKDLAPSGAT